MYQLNENGVISLSDNAYIPADLGNRDYTDFIAWKASGNEPLPIPPKSEEQLRAEWKKERAAAVAAITVEVDGMLFQGDEISQTRMARSVSVMEDGETIRWVLVDNTPVLVTKAQLREALRLAGIRQSELWVQS